VIYYLSLRRGAESNGHSLRSDVKVPALAAAKGCGYLAIAENEYDASFASGVADARPSTDTSLRDAYVYNAREPGRGSHRPPALQLNPELLGESYCADRQSILVGLTLGQSGGQLLDHDTAAQITGELSQAHIQSISV
jgi:hypothetical protein